MSHRNTQQKAEAAKGDKYAADQYYGERPESNFPIAALRLLCFVYCSAYASLHGCLWS